GEPDRVTVELPAPESGTVTKILKKKGEKAAVGEVIGYLENGAAPAKPAAKTQAAPPRTAGPRGMPSAPRARQEKGLTPAQVPAPGPGGRSLKEDVLVAEKAPPQAPPPPTAPAGREEELVPMTPMRKRIAERLLQAQSAAALLTTFNEIDMSAVVALRKEHQ